MGIPDEYILTVENGVVLEFDAENATIGERLPGGYVFVAGTSVGDVGPAVLRDREALASNGVVTVAFKWDFEARSVVGTPEITSRGFVYEREAGDLLTGAVERLAAALRETSRVSKRGLEEATREALTRYFNDRTGRRPVIVTLVLES
jgi:ribonuclease J